MKRYLSIFGMFARQNLSWLLGICTLMALVQSYYFAGVCAEGAQQLHKALIHYEMNHIFVFCFLLLTIRLCVCGCDRTGKSAYTYNRLQIPQTQILLIQAIFHLFAYWVLFTVQLLLLLVFSAIYSRVYPQHIAHMTLLLASYQVPLFHLVLPLQDSINWAGTLVTIGALSLCSAMFPLRQRSGKVSITAILMILLAVFYLYIQIYENTYFDISGSVISILGSVFLAGCALAGVWATEVDDYEQT